MKEATDTEYAIASIIAYSMIMGFGWSFIVFGVYTLFNEDIYFRWFLALSGSGVIMGIIAFNTIRHWLRYLRLEKVIL